MKFKVETRKKYGRLHLYPESKADEDFLWNLWWNMESKPKCNFIMNKSDTGVNLREIFIQFNIREKSREKNWDYIIGDKAPKCDNCQYLKTSECQHPNLGGGDAVCTYWGRKEE